jgi:hypothetical protein
MTPSNRNDPKPSTCAFIGFVIVFAKANLLFIGKKAVSTAQIILQNTMRPRTIKLFAPLICMSPAPFDCLQDEEDDPPKKVTFSSTDV